MAEALATDQARTADLQAVLRGFEPVAEANLRALMAGDELEPDPPPSPEPELVGASITDLADWVDNANRLLGGSR